MGKEKTPTFEEYRDEVKKHLKHYMSWMDDKELDEYLNESKDYVTNSYEDEKRDFEAGKINIRQFMEAGASGTAYGLHMMY